MKSSKFIINTPTVLREQQKKKKNKKKYLYRYPMIMPPSNAQYHHISNPLVSYRKKKKDIIRNFSKVEISITIQTFII